MTLVFGYHRLMLFSACACCGATIHFCLKGCIVFVPFILSFAGFAVVVEVCSDAMRPAVRDGCTFGVCSLRGEGLSVRFLFVSFIAVGGVVVADVTFVDLDSFGNDAADALLCNCRVSCRCGDMRIWRRGSF